MTRDNFNLLFDLTYIFNMRHYRIVKAVGSLMDQGYFMFPTEKVRKDLWKAKLENNEAEDDLRKHFLRI